MGGETYEHLTIEDPVGTALEGPVFFPGERFVQTLGIANIVRHPDDVLEGITPSGVRVAARPDSIELWGPDEAVRQMVQRINEQYVRMFD